MRPFYCLSSLGTSEAPSIVVGFVQPLILRTWELFFFVSRAEVIRAPLPLSQSTVMQGHRAVGPLEGGALGIGAHGGAGGLLDAQCKLFHAQHRSQSLLSAVRMHLEEDRRRLPPPFFPAPRRGPSADARH